MGATGAANYARRSNFPMINILRTDQVLSCVLQCVAVCCSVLQCVAVCCSVLQCVAVCVAANYARRSNFPMINILRTDQVLLCVL